jgi:predicted transcriptional regulator
MQLRQEAHTLLEALPEEKLVAVRNLLVVMSDSPSYSMENAPFEDEELTPQMEARLNKAEEEFERGEVVTHEQVLREFGL